MSNPYDITDRTLAIQDGERHWRATTGNYHHLERLGGRRFDRAAGQQPRDIVQREAQRLVHEAAQRRAAAS